MSAPASSSATAACDVALARGVMERRQAALAESAGGGPSAFWRSVGCLRAAAYRRRRAGRLRRAEPPLAEASSPRRVSGLRAPAAPPPRPPPPPPAAAAPRRPPAARAVLPVREILARRPEWPPAPAPASAPRPAARSPRECCAAASRRCDRSALLREVDDLRREVDVGAALDEHLDDVDLPGGRGEDQRRLSRFVFLRVDVRAGVEERRHRVDAAGRGGQVQRRDAARRRSPSRSRPP